MIIAGSNFDNLSMNKEKKFYEEILKQSNLNFEKNYFLFKKINDEYSSYKLIDSSSLTVFIDSALGYQSLARGNKTFGCSIRSKYVRNKNLNFGWPNTLKKEGPFWINHFNKNKIEKKLEFLYNLPLSSWHKIYQKYKSKLLIYDNGNYIFKKIVKKHVK